MIKIRRATEQDAETLANLWKNLLAEQHEVDARFAAADDAIERWLNDLGEWIHAPDVRHIVVADSEADTVGFASAQLWWPPLVYEQKLEVYLDELYVKPEFRRQGVGTQLLESVESWARKQEVSRIRIGTLAKNTETIDFWKEKGAREFLVALLLEV